MLLNRDFKEFAQSLNAEGVEYLLVGGYALAAHGHPRYTGDIHFWLAPRAPKISNGWSAPCTDSGSAHSGSRSRISLQTSWSNSGIDPDA